MADGLPDGFEVDAGTSPPNGFTVDPPTEKPSFLGTMGSTLTGAPSQIYKAGKSAFDTMLAHEQQKMTQAQKEPSSLLTDWLGAPEDVAAVASAPMAPVANVYNAAAQTIAGPMASGIQAVGEPIARAFNPNATMPSHEDVYGQVEPEVETALNLVRRRYAAPVPVPAKPSTGPFGVMLSEGQSTGDIGLIQREQNARRLGDPHATAFFDQQADQLTAAQERINKSFDPYFGQQLAESPQQAGQMVSQGVQSAAAISKQAVDTAYEMARSYPGEFTPDVFTNMGDRIKRAITSGPDSVIINDKLTPFASQAIRHIDDSVGQLQIQNRASPFPQPSPQNIVGVNLEGVNQIRKQLSSYRKGAFAANAEDGRAAQAVIKAFDDAIDSAVNGGQFNGDPRAVRAWNAARAANADYRSTFSGGRGDPVGKVVEKIIGKDKAGPAIPNDVADFFMGSSGVNPNSLNVATANRIKSILGENSPEWIGAKQGLFQRLIEKTGQDWGPGRVAGRLENFLTGDGAEMARAVYSPAEQQPFKDYAAMLRQLEIPRGQVFPSAPLINRALGAIGDKIGMATGAMVARTIMPFAPPLVAEGLGAGTAEGISKLAARREAMAVRKQMPLLADQVAKWQKAVLRANKINSGPSQALAATQAAGLFRSLSRIGVHIPELAGSDGNGTIQAQPNQPNVPGPANQQQRGGRVNQQQHFAHGGKVTPESIGARRAKDGKYYLPDPKRPGKYLMVVPKRKMIG